MLGGTCREGSRATSKLDSQTWGGAGMSIETKIIHAGYAKAGCRVHTTHVLRRVCANSLLALQLQRMHPPPLVRGEGNGGGGRGSDSHVPSLSPCVCMCVCNCPTHIASPACAALVAGAGGY